MLSLPARAAHIALLAALVAGVAGCGGGSRSGAPTAAQGAATRSAAGTGSAKAKLSSHLSAHAQSVAFAHSVNLRLADVPGFRIHHKHPPRFNTQYSGPSESEWRRCVAAGPDVKPSLKARSAKLETGSGLMLEEVSSHVEVAPSLAAAHRGFSEASRVLADPGARRCIAGLTRKFTLHGSTTVATRFGPAKVSFSVGGLRLAPISLAAQPRDTAGFSMTMQGTYSLAVRGRTLTLPPVTLQIDTIAFRVGRADISLNDLALGRPCSPERENQLLSLLRSRANAAAAEYPSVGLGAPAQASA
jgi:hypothetical protein